MPARSTPRGGVAWRSGPTGRPSGGGRAGQGCLTVGIDPSRVALRIAAHGDRRRARRVPLGPAAAECLEAIIGEQPAVLALAGAHATGQPLLLELLARRFDGREVQPVVSKRFRQALGEDHTDRQDATGLAQLARWRPALPGVRFSEEQAVCKRLARLREQVVQDRTRYVNRRHACLSETYGAVYKQLFVDPLAKKALRFFAGYPTVNDALAAGEEVVAQVGQGGRDRLEQAGCWREGAYRRCLRLEVRTPAAQVLALEECVAEPDRALAAAPLPPTVALLRRLPGIGTATALTTAGDTGDPARFPDAHHYVASCGLAPAMHQSGASGPSAKPRHRYDRHLKRAFLLLALVQVRWRPRARAYYARKRAEGKAYRAALRCLARQLCRIVFRMLTHNQLYAPPTPLT
jgi:transposase